MPPSGYESQPGYMPPPGYESQPGYPPPQGYGPPGSGTPPYAPPGYLPASYYAGPTDPLVSADFGGWWARSFRLLQTAWRPLVLVQLFSVIPLLVVSIAADITTGEQVTRFAVSSGTDIDWDALARPLLILAPLFLVVLILGLTTDLAMLRILVQQATGRPVDIAAALRDGLRRTPALIGWGILAGLLALVGLLFCLLPGFYVIAVMTILPAVVLLERGEGIGRSFRLFHADFGAALGRVATLIGLTIGISFLESTITGIITPTSFEDGAISITAAAIAQIISAAFAIASGLITTPMILTAYADMRARREPFSTAYLATTP